MKKKIFIKLFIIINIITIVSCSEFKERYEIVDKLRSLGVKVDTPYITITKDEEKRSEVNLTFYVAHRKDQNITSYSSFELERSNSIYYYPITVSIIENSLTTTKYEDISISSFKASIQAPAIDKTLKNMFSGSLRLRYAVLVKSKEDEEKIVGEIRVVEENNESLSWSQPTINLISPDLEEYKENDKINLTATLSKPQDEIIKVSWFVTTGEVKNRKAIKTEWSKQKEGKRTVIFAIYPKNSLFFDFEVKEINIQK